jgi:hypothetical protein
MELDDLFEKVEAIVANGVVGKVGERGWSRPGED